MFTILDYSSALEYGIIRRYTNIVYYYYNQPFYWNKTLFLMYLLLTLNLVKLCEILYDFNSPNMCGAIMTRIPTLKLEGYANSPPDLHH